MANKGVTLRNLNDVKRKDSNLGQALDDVVTHLSANKTDIASIQTDIAAIKKKLGL